MSAAAKGRGGRLAVIVAIVVAVVAVTAVVVALVITAQPGFYDRYTGLQRRHTTLESSAHAGIDCVVCHTRQDLGSQAARVGEFYASLLSTSTDLRFVTFQPPTSAACLQCHRYDWSDVSSQTAKVPHPAHLRVADETRDCVKCHKWIAHEETYQAKHTTMPFSAVCASFGCHVGVKQSTDCQKCHHVLQEGTADWRATHQVTVRAAGPGGCVEKCHTPAQCRQCHTTGVTPVVQSDFATASASVAAIGQKHVAADWLTAHGTLALASPTLCTTCHISEGECVDCHSMRPAFHGSPTTWLKAHQPLGKNTARCLTCHKQPECDACHAQFKLTH